MSRKRMWTKEEDEELLKIAQESGLIKWSMVARTMKQRFGRRARNQKQCRDRFINYLNVEDSHTEWTSQDQKRMIELHKQHGNKWVKIAAQFPGMYFFFYFRSQNSIKNKFYSRLRRSIRKLNRIARQSPKKPFKAFKLGIVFKLSSLVDHNNIAKRTTFGSYQKSVQSLSFLNVGFFYLLLDLSAEKTNPELTSKKSEDVYGQLLGRGLQSILKISNLLKRNNRTAVKKITRSPGADESSELMGRCQQKTISGLEQSSAENKFGLLFEQMSKHLNGLFEWRPCDATVDQHQQEVDGLLSEMKTRQLSQIIIGSEEFSVSQINQTKQANNLDYETSKQSRLNHDARNTNFSDPLADLQGFEQEHSSINSILYEGEPHSVPNDMNEESVLSQSKEFMVKAEQGGEGSFEHCFEF